MAKNAGAQLELDSSGPFTINLSQTAHTAAERLSRLAEKHRGVLFDRYRLTVLMGRVTVDQNGGLIGYIGSDGTLQTTFGLYNGEFELIENSQNCERLWPKPEEK